MTDARPAHLFTFTPADLVSSYTAPDGQQPTRYTYNRDRQLTSVIRPDGSSIGFGYNGAGQLAAM